MDPAARGGGLALLARAPNAGRPRQGARADPDDCARASHARVGRLYERRGYRALETSYQAPVTPAMTALTVVDDVLPDVGGLSRGDAARSRSATVEPAPGVVFHGIARRGR